MSENSCRLNNVCLLDIPYVYVIAWLGVIFGINTTSIVVGMAKLHEAKPSAICHSHYNTSGIYPKFHMLSQINTIQPRSSLPSGTQRLLSESEIAI